MNIKIQKTINLENLPTEILENFLEDLKTMTMLNEHMADLATKIKNIEDPKIRRETSVMLSMHIDNIRETLTLIDARLGDYHNMLISFDQLKEGIENYGTEYIFREEEQNSSNELIKNSEGRKEKTIDG